MLDYRTHTFLEVYRQRSFTRAAENLLITQPAASQHSRQMETHYGCTLFVKTGRGIEPTAAADLLYPRPLTMETDEARRAIEAVALAAEPSDTREAPRRHIHQPDTHTQRYLLIFTASAIRQMETHYGCTLFVKTGRGIEPTAAADLLYQRLLTMENDEARLAIEAGALAAEPTNTREAPLRLGCPRTIAYYTAPRLMAEHLSTHPQAEVTLLTGNTRELVRSLEEGTIRGGNDRLRPGRRLF